MAEPTKGLTFIDLGQTPVYATSSWQFLSQHFHGKRTHILATPPGADIVDFCLIPRSSPHFAGASDPIAVIALLSSGELITLSFPSGHPISPTNMLHPSLSFVHPFVTSAQVTMVNTTRWLGMTEKRNQGPPILIGGAPLSKVVRRSYDRTILQTAHGDGTIRLFDASTTDKLENSRVLQVDVARALGCYENIAITEMSLAGQTGEMAVGTRSGEAIIFRWGVNKNVGHDPPPPSPKQCQPGEIVNIQDRTDPTLKEGLQPFVMFNAARGPITALQMSDVGFVAVGSEGGEFSIIDLRGPAIIFSGNVAEFAKQEKKGLFGKSHKRGQSIAGGDWPTKIAFGVMTLEDDQYSSICCFVGTNMGKVATFKILPLQNGTYAAQLAGVIQCNDRVMAICPMRTESGEPAVADGPTVAGLREGRAVNGTLVVGKFSFALFRRSPLIQHSNRTRMPHLHPSLLPRRNQNLGRQRLNVPLGLHHQLRASRARSRRRLRRRVHSCLCPSLPTHARCCRPRLPRPLAPQCLPRDADG